MYLLLETFRLLNGGGMLFMFFLCNIYLLNYCTNSYFCFYINRDESVLKDWRDETKRLKEKKLYESLRKGTKGLLFYAVQL